MVNPTENRAAEHTALRGVGKEASVEEAAALRERMRLLVEAIHEGALGEVRHLIHIGIGGSALGPALAVDALARDWRAWSTSTSSRTSTGCALEAAFAACDPATTLIAVASQDLHHHRDDDQRRERARLARARTASPIPTAG